MIKRMSLVDKRTLPSLEVSDLCFGVAALLEEELAYDYS